MYKVTLLTLLVLPIASARFMNLLGSNCYDSNGCATCSGYSWCETLETCLRLWEQPCEDN